MMVNTVEIITAGVILASVVVGGGMYLIGRLILNLIENHGDVG